MLSLTKKTDYALIALGYLKEHPTDVVSSREISEHYGMPGYLMMNIMKSLHHANFITSIRGTKGGYRLAVELSKLNLHDLVTALEGPVEMAECVCEESRENSSNCRIGKCPIKHSMKRLHDQFVGFLKDISLSNILIESAMPERETAANA